MRLHDRHTREISHRVCALPATLGRDSGTASVVLDDTDVSRRHARIEMAGNELVVVDLDSTNGTYINDKRVTRHVLVPGDRLRMGRYEVTWSFIDSSSTRLIDPGQLTAARRVVPGGLAARRVVEAAEAHNKRAGHELDGFLSVAHGFLPAEQPLLAFPESHRAWDDMTASLPDLFRRLSLRRAFRSSTW